MFSGTQITFCKWTYKAISNYEIDLSGKTGLVISVGPGAMEIKLDEHMPELDEWDNTLVWLIEDCLFGERLDNWEDVSPEKAYGFFAGYLASMVTK
jgi:hypothetical protein